MNESVSPEAGRQQREPPTVDAGGSLLQTPYDAVIFDMDGVVTDTAVLHVAAWKRLFDEVLADPRLGAAPSTRPFDPVEDYDRHLEGRRDEEAVAAFLAARRIRVPTGAPEDPSGAWTVHGLAARKNDLFLEQVADDGIRAFPGTVSLVRRLRQGGIPLGLATGSRNATALLSRAGLLDAFDVVVDGEVLARLGLPGKPDPAMFLEAARRLGVAAARTAVIEDSVAGVTAARRGGFGLVAAIDRAGRRHELERAGAAFVLGDVAELDLGISESDPWLLVFGGFDPAHETHREALTALGNGYMATRGAMPEHVDDGVHYPGTYLAGVYDRLVSRIEGEEREDEELVNAPNWLPVDVRVGEGEWWSAGGLVEREERRELDLQRGVLTRSARLVDPLGRVLRLVQRRLVSMDRPHLAALETALVPEGWSGRLSVRSGIDARVVNGNVIESHMLANRHLGEPTVEHLGATLLVEVETTQSRVRIATAALTTVRDADCRPVPDDAEGRGQVRFEVQGVDGQPIVVDKLVAVATSRDAAVASARAGALSELEQGIATFDELLRRHALAWRRLWEHFAVDIDSEDPVQLGLNLHVFHTLQTISPHTAGLDVGIPARGLHGEGYRGHVFWDELFVLPLYVMRTPDVARSLLDYRWRRLNAARRAAQLAGHRGAMFPWQSGSDGRDETPRTLFNPRSGRWIPDRSWRQRHVGLAVAYNAWQYYQATTDGVWLAGRGAELILEVARFFSDLATYDPLDGRFHIAGVMGPDEYHDGYPGALDGGLRDNAYTNVLTAWLCGRAVETLSLLPPHEREELTQRLGLGAEEADRWELLWRRLAVPFHDGVISQFEAYGDLVELDWERYRRIYGNIERLDLILESEGDSANRYRLSKQADVLMLLYVLGPAEVLRTLSGLGYALTTEDLRRAVDYYLARSAHGSTLSRVVHTSVLASLDSSAAWTEFREALDADMDDTQGGTTGHGIHLGAMAGTVDIVLRTFTGLRMEAGSIVFRPRAPGALRAAAFEVRYRDQWIAVAMDHRSLRLTARPGIVQPVRVVVDDLSTVLSAGASLEFPIVAR
jgi:beta-phosphoglucomutase family hydrolase